MDRITVYRGELPYETDFLGGERSAYEGLGLALLDIMGATTVVGGLPCTPTTPASLAVNVGPGRIYKKDSLEPAAWGVVDATGGLAADTDANHQILKQGLSRDVVLFNITPPVTVGQSVVYLIQAAFLEADDAAQPKQFYNTANPNAPISKNVSPARRDKCVLSLKAGNPATTGSQTAPTADAGNVPVWNITVAYGATTITAGNIVQNPGAPLVGTVGGGGGGGGGSYIPPTWVDAAGTITATAGGHYKANNGGGNVVINLPATPADGDFVRVSVNVVVGGNTVTINRNGKLINGAASNWPINKNYVGPGFLYNASYPGGASWQTMP